MCSKLRVNWCLQFKQLSNKKLFLESLCKCTVLQPGKVHYNRFLATLPEKLDGALQRATAGRNWVLICKAEYLLG